MDEIWIVYLFLALPLAIVGWKTGYAHVKIKIWVLILFMVFGTPISAFLYMGSANKAKRDGKQAPQKKPSEKTNNKEHKGIQLNKTKVLWISSITTSVIAILVIILFVSIVPEKYNEQIEKGKESSTLIYVQGSNAFKQNSINKSYVVYLIEADSNFYIFQIISESDIRVYRTYTYNSNLDLYNTTKAAILDYFNAVREEEPPQKSLVGGIVTAGYVVSIAFILCSGILWTTWFFKKNDNGQEIIEKAI